MYCSKVPAFSIVLNALLIILEYFKVVKDDSFYWVIARMKCEGEWNSVILFLL